MVLHWILTLATVSTLINVLECCSFTFILVSDFNSPVYADISSEATHQQSELFEFRKKNDKHIFKINAPHGCGRKKTIIRVYASHSDNLELVEERGTYFTGNNGLVTAHITPTLLNKGYHIQWVTRTKVTRSDSPLFWP